MTYKIPNGMINSDWWEWSTLVSICLSITAECGVEYHLVGKLEVVEGLWICILRDRELRKRYIPSSSQENNSPAPLRGTILSCLQDSKLYLIATQNISDIVQMVDQSTVTYPRAISARSMNLTTPILSLFTTCLPWPCLSRW